MNTRESATLRTRSLRRAAASTVSGRLIALAVTFAATPLVVHGLGNAQYGVFATVTMISSVLAFSDFGVGSGLVTRLASVDGLQDPHESRKLVAAAQLVLASAAVLVGVVVTATAAVVPVDQLLGAPAADAAPVRRAVIVYALLFSLAIPCALGQRIQVALQQGTRAAAWSTAVAVSATAAPAIAAVRGDSLTVVVMCAGAPPVILGALQTRFVLRREHPTLRTTRHDLDGQTVRTLLRSSGSFVVLQLAIAVGFQTDQFIIANMLGATTAGKFALALRLFTLVTLITGLLCSQFWPATAEAMANGDRQWVRRTHRQLTFLTTASATIASLVLLILGQAFITWWVGPGLVPPLSLLLAMGLWSIWLALLQPTAMLLNGAHALTVQVWTAVAMAAVNLPLSLWLTTKVGITGPVIGSLIASVATTGVPTFRTCRRLLADQKD